ncbi:hypothetical protein AB4Y90_00175 [Chryseobacterium sp. 2TAF14]|uniref:hypothetical protein n=1 Tax=Chryseobacterium sp. 2TAF14 TaxID=3233007 RepID=UPI003F91E45A
MKYSIISILLSLITLFFSIKINLETLIDYLSTDGKSQAFHGLIELKYLYKYYFLILSFLSSLFLVFAFKINELKPFKHSAAFILILGIVSVFTAFWKWFI